MCSKLVEYCEVTLANPQATASDSSSISSQLLCGTTFSNKNDATGFAQTATSVSFEAERTHIHAKDIGAELNDCAGLVEAV